MNFFSIFNLVMSIVAMLTSPQIHAILDLIHGLPAHHSQAQIGKLAEEIGLILQGLPSPMIEAQMAAREGNQATKP